MPIPKLLPALGLILISFIIAACASVAPLPNSATPPTLAPVKLKVLYSRFLSYAPYFIADAEGFFAAQGLAVELVQVNIIYQSIPALLQGQVDVLAGSLSPAYFNAIGRGGKIRFVADKGYVAAAGCPTNALLIRTELAKKNILDNPSTWRGLTLKADPTNFGGYWVGKYLNTKGLKLDDFKNTNIPNEVVSESLSKGALDLAETSDPWVNRILQDKNGVLVMSAGEVVPDFQLGLIVYGPNLLDNNPEAGKRFMVAYLQGVRQYNQGKTSRNLEIISKYTGLDREFLTSSCWQPIHDNGRINVSSIFDFQTYLMDRKLIDSPVTDEKKMWDPSFVEYANQMLKRK